MAVHMRKQPGQLTVVIKLGKYKTVHTICCAKKRAPDQHPQEHPR